MVKRWPSCLLLCTTRDRLKLVQQLQQSKCTCQTSDLHTAFEAELQWYRLFKSSSNPAPTCPNRHLPPLIGWRAKQANT